jgi:DNA repair protein RecO (recombination protein O)
VRPGTTEAIVLHTYPSRERDKLVVFLTPEEGKRRGWAYGARSLRSRFGASLEPLTKVVMVYVWKESEEVVRIESASIVRSLFAAQQRLETSVAATYVAETVDTFIQPDDPSEVVYRLLDRASEALLAGDDPVAVVAWSEIWMLRLAGVLPTVKSCVACGSTLESRLVYDVDHGGFACIACAAPRSVPISPAATDLLGSLFRLPAHAFATTVQDRNALSEVRSLARDMRRRFLGHELKSYEIVQAVLSAGPQSGTARSQ